MAETLRQAKAFDLYYSMGSNRSYQAVADQIGVSKNIVYRWSKYFSWKKRIAERDAENAKKMFESTDENIVESMTNYRKIIKASIGNYVKQLKDGVIKIESPRDFIKLAELDIKIIEILENNENNDTNHAVSNETLETLKAIKNQLENVNEPEPEDGEEEDV